jgi:hypothetical protein
MVCENKVLKRIFGPKERNNDIMNSFIMYSSPKIIRAIGSGKMILAGHIAYKGLYEVIQRKILSENLD